MEHESSDAQLFYKGGIIITSYTIGTGFDRFDVIPLSNLPQNSAPLSEKSPNIPLYIAPDLNADVAVSSPAFVENDPASPFSFVLAAAKFILDYRGLPLDELTVKCGNKILTAIKKGNDGEICVLIPKCKELCSKMAINVDNIELNIAEFVLENISARVVECYDTELFSAENLKRLLYRKECEGCDIAVCYSISEEGVTMRWAANTKKTTFFALASAVAVATGLSYGKRCDKIRISTDEGTVFFENFGKYLLYSFDQS